MALIPHTQFGVKFRDHIMWSKALPPYSCYGSWFHPMAHLWKPRCWKQTNIGVHNSCWEIPTNTAATKSFTLTYSLRDWQMKDYSQSTGYVIPFPNPPPSKVWLLPKNTTNIISTTIRGLLNKNSNTKRCANCLLSQINTRLLSQQMYWHAVSTTACQHQPLSLPSTHHQILLAASIQLSCFSILSTLLQHYSVPDLLCFVAQCLLHV